MRTVPSFLAFILLVSCGGGGSGGSGDVPNTPPPPAASLLWVKTDVNDDGVQDTLLIDKTRSPGDRVRSAFTTDPLSGSPVALPRSSVSPETLQAILTWEAQSADPNADQTAVILGIDSGLQPTYIQRLR